MIPFISNHNCSYHHTTTTSLTYYDGARRPSKPRSKINSSTIPTFQFSLIRPISKVYINPRISLFKMSDNIPFDIQMEIIKKVSNVKSLIRFRSVSKPWKSFIDSSDFIKGYGARHTLPHSRILCLSPGSDNELRYICLVDDDIETFMVQQEFAPFVVPPLLQQYPALYVVGACHGLLCLFCYNRVYNKRMLVIWNPSIGKSFGIDVPEYDPYIEFQPVYGFGVCPVTSDPTVVKVLSADNMPWHVEVFTLSSRVWNVIPSGTLPRQSIRLNNSTKVVIDRFIYWGACEKISTDDGESTTNHMVVSFDMITKEFKVVDLPDSLTNEIIQRVSLSKLRESLVVYGITKAEEALCDVWVMERDLSFRNLFSISAPVTKILGFTKSGEPICEIVSEFRQITTHDVFSYLFNTLNVYDPCSRHIKNLGISGVGGSFFISCYKESILLLDHSDLQIY